MNYYDIIGVPPDAPADEIRRVFREKATMLHPDKATGDHATMAALNHAYEVLIDPKTREIYDRTGKDSETPLEVEVRNVILQSFTQALMKDAPDALKFAKDLLESGKRELTATIEKIKSQQQKFTSRRNKITRKKGDNCFQMIIDQQLIAMAGEKEKAEAQLVIIEAAIKEIGEYRSTEKTPPTVLAVDWRLRGAATNSY